MQTKKHSLFMIIAFLVGTSPAFSDVCPHITDGKIPSEWSITSAGGSKIDQAPRLYTVNWMHTEQGLGGLGIICSYKNDDNSIVLLKNNSPNFAPSDLENWNSNGDKCSYKFSRCICNFAGSADQCSFSPAPPAQQ